VYLFSVLEASCAKAIFEEVKAIIKIAKNEVIFFINFLN
jgi:hypothetical protein